ncbi:MAG TPA: DUF4390 domain-containing protein, partial [Burkholderiales bacterium]|nr:DUF4390 domain-containing protein [Burkholderiales bacterium]
MMDFITRYCIKISAALRLAARFFALCVAASALLGAGVARGDGIDVRKAAVTPVDDGYVIEAELDVRLTSVLDDALHKGVPLYFVLDFELIRARWYWTNEKVAVVQQQQRLSYNTLTRQYRVGVGALYQNFSTIKEALDYMSQVRRRLDVEPGALRKDTVYAAMLRMRLDVTQLPKPFQLQTGRNWDMS